MTPDLLGEHIDDPAGTRHRCALLDARRLRCHDCARTLVLPTAQPARGTSSTLTGPVPLHHPDRCPAHPGQWAPPRCGACRAEQLQAERHLQHTPTADVATGAAAVRQAVDAARTKRNAQAAAAAQPDAEAEPVTS